jgi:hypothetical protein
MLLPRVKLSNVADRSAPDETNLERFPAKWIPVRVKKTRQIENQSLRSDSIGTEALAAEI